MPLVPHVAAGQIVASTWGNNVADQVVMRFTTAAQRTSQLTSPLVGQLTSLDSAPGALDYWNGTAWVPFRGASEEYAYAQTTAPKTVAATVETSADLVVAAPAISFDGTTPVIVETYTPGVVPPAVAGAVLYLLLYQDGVSIGRLGAVLNNAAGTLLVPVLSRRRFTPTAGSHTLSFAAIVSGSTGNVQAGAGGVGNYMPAYIRILRA
jgi:hypothetical protein